MRRHIRVAQALVADLRKRDLTGEALAHAQAVLDFYVAEARNRDWLVGPSGELTPPPKPRRRTRRARFKRNSAADIIVQMIQSAGRPMSPREIRLELRKADYPHSRQAVWAALRSLKEDRIVENRGSRNRALWALREDFAPPRGSTLVASTTRKAASVSDPTKEPSGEESLKPERVQREGEAEEGENLKPERVQREGEKPAEGEGNLKPERVQ